MSKSFRNDRITYCYIMGSNFIPRNWSTKCETFAKMPLLSCLAKTFKSLFETKTYKDFLEMRRFRGNVYGPWLSRAWMAVEQHAVLDIEVQTLMSCDFLPCRVDSDQIDERYCHMLACLRCIVACFENACLLGVVNWPRVLDTNLRKNTIKTPLT